MNSLPVSNKSYLIELEGLRGLAALWVLMLHIGHLTGINVWFFNWGALGVDLFILLSGFLMVHQFELRREKHPWTKLGTMRDFWIRRFFRIAPLFYLLLIATFWAQPILERAKKYIVEHSAAFCAPAPQVTWDNFVAHLSFTFGAIPGYAYNSQLPDWTLGLEMQFYLIFPFLMLVALKFGYRTLAAMTLFLIMALNLILSGFVQSFPMPSFLPLKMHLFLIGMLIAAKFHNKVSRNLVLLCAAVLPFMPFVEGIPSASALWMAREAVLALIFFALTSAEIKEKKSLKPFLRILNSRLLQWLGDISYSVYLVHLAIAPLLVALLLHIPWLVSLPVVPRYLVFASAILSEVLLVSHFLYRFVERPGIALGKRIIASLNSKVLPVVNAAGD